MKVVYIIERSYFSESEQKYVADYFEKRTPFSFEFCNKKHQALSFNTKKEALDYRGELWNAMSGSPTLKVITYVSELPEAIQAVTLKEVKALYAELGTEFEPSGDSYYAAEQYDVFEFATLAEREAFIRNRREQYPADTNGYPG